MNQNVLPAPGVLSTPIVPPIISTSRLEIASPRPVPPYLRVVELSACEKDWNNRSRASGPMPIPVSVMANRISASWPVSSTTLLRTTISPRSVNFTALPARFVRTCRRRPGSPPVQLGRLASGR